MTDVLAVVAGYGLDSRHVWPREPLGAEAWAHLVARVRNQRLTGLLNAAVTHGELPTTGGQVREAEGLHRDAVFGSLALESVTLRTIDALDSAGVPVRVLKGPAVAHLDYPDPALRLFGDVDVLVHPDHFDRGVATLVAAGNTRLYPEPRPGFDRRFSKGASFTTPDMFEIDYHRTFVMGPYGLRLDIDDLWADSREFELGGRTFRALDDDVRFLHACYHAALGSIVPRLVPMRDVAQMLLQGRTDLARVHTLARRWGAEPVVARAVGCAWTELGLEDRHPLAVWASHYRPDRRAARELAAYSRPGSNYAGKSLAALAALPRWQDKVAFAAALTFPASSYVEGRTSASSRWGRALGAARRARRTT